MFKRPQRVVQKCEKTLQGDQKERKKQRRLWKYCTTRDLQNLYEMVKQKKNYERSYVKEFHGNCSVSKTRKNFFLQDIGNS